MDRLWTCLVGAAVAISVPAVPGCGRQTGGDLAILELQCEAIDLVPGTQRHVKVQSGKAEAAVPDNKPGLTAKVENNEVTVCAAGSASRGKHVVRVRDGNAKEAILMVNVVASARK